MQPIRSITIVLLTLFNVFYGAVGLYWLSFQSNHLERELEKDAFCWRKIRILQCFLTSFVGLLQICTKHKGFKMFVSH